MLQNVGIDFDCIMTPLTRWKGGEKGEKEEKKSRSFNTGSSVGCGPAGPLSLTVLLAGTL